MVCIFIPCISIHLVGCLHSVSRNNMIWNIKMTHRNINNSIFTGDCSANSQCDTGKVCQSGSCGMHICALLLCGC